jgi:hypothetical protein
MREEHRNNTKLSLPVGYAEMLDNLKSSIRTAREKSALAVNRELVILHWQIGSEILKRQDEEGWGARVIDRFSQDLRSSFPEMKGFSTRNLKYMRKFAETWPAEVIVQQLAAQIPWMQGRIQYCSSSNAAAAAAFTRLSDTDNSPQSAYIHPFL